MGLAYSFDVLYTLSPAWESACARVASLGKDCGVMRSGGQDPQTAYVQDPQTAYVQDPQTAYVVKATQTAYVGGGDT